MNPNEELHEIVRQLKTELEWATRTGIVIENRHIEPAPILAPSPQANIAAEMKKPTSPPVIRSRPNLKMIREDLGDCTRCKLHKGRTNIVFGVGNPDADLMFIGEGPGADEDRTGEPFVGPAGQLLTKIMVAMGFERNTVYIANIVKCRPPKNRDPDRDEIDACIGFLRAQVAAVQPKVIVCLGRPASQTLLQTQTSISRLRGQWHKFESIPVMPTFHPSYLLRSPENKRSVWEDMQAVVAKLGRTLPKRS